MFIVRPQKALIFRKIQGRSVKDLEELASQGLSNHAPLDREYIHVYVCACLYCQMLIVDEEVPFRVNSANRDLASIKFHCACMPAKKKTRSVKSRNVTKDLRRRQT